MQTATAEKTLPTIRNSERSWTYRVTGGTGRLTTDHFTMMSACEECLRRGASMEDLDAILNDFKLTQGA